jgi:hypothetical protein
MRSLIATVPYPKELIGLIYADVELINAETFHWPATMRLAKRKLNDCAWRCWSICRAMVLPGDSEPLLEAIPLEDMDVLFHPLRQELIVNPDHPYYAQMVLKGIREVKE